MRRIFLAVFLLACCIYGAITIDGKLDEAEWQAVEEMGGFEALGISVNKAVQAQTTFKIITLEDRLCIGVKCDEPLMDKLKEMTAKKKTPSGDEDDAVEIFLTPTGNANYEFYQFRVCYDGNGTSNYWADASTTQPDPYFPEWSNKVYSGKDFWSAEIEIPISAFYMTPQHLWKTEWAVNIGRRRKPVKENTTWSQMQSSFAEIGKFAKLGGFPMRKAEDFVQISSAKACVKTMEKGKPAGKLSVNVNLYKAGEYELQGRTFKLTRGLNMLNVPYVFGQTGKNLVEIALKRTRDGRVFKRWYPVNVKYEPIKFCLSWPQYHNNFYPGQDFSHIEGEVECAMNKPVNISISGPGIKNQKITLKPGKKAFRFKTSDFDYGTAIIKAEAGGITRELKVRRLQPTNSKMVWIENGNLVVMNPGEKKGKAILPRRMSATYLKGGEAFKQRYEADKDLHMEIIGACSIEPVRLGKNVEIDYGYFDVRPLQSLFGKISDIIAKNKNRNFHYYYLYDDPECHNISPVFLKHVYDFIADKDPYHPVMIVSRKCGLYIDCADWFETRPRLNPMIDGGHRIYDCSIDNMGGYMDEIALSGRKDKIIGFMPTCFSNRDSNPLSVYPTFQEIVCHTWAGMIHGGKGLHPYTFRHMGDRPCLYEGIRYIFSTFDVLQDFMLFAKRTVLHRSDEYEVVLYELGKEKMFAAVNFTAVEQLVHIKGQSGRYMECRGNRSFNGISFTLKPHEVIVGTTRKRDEGLPTYKQVQAKIDNLEKQRLDMPNLLIGHIDDVKVTASRSIPFWFKLFDGVRDVYAYDDSWGQCRFVELSFSRKFIPAFTSISIYGKNIDDAIVKVLKAGIWQEIKPASKTKDNYMLKYLFDQEYSVGNLRIEFPQNHIELYEIELFNNKKPKAEEHLAAKASHDDEKHDIHDKREYAWQLDGSNAQFKKSTSKDAWFGEDTYTEPTADGGFLYRGKNSNRYIKLMPKHWIVLKLMKINKMPNYKQYNWSMNFFRGVGKICGNNNLLQEGLYTINLPEVTKNTEGPMTIYSYGLEMQFNYIRLVREPENYLSATVEGNSAMIEPGSKIIVTLKLKEPCKEVTCKMIRDIGHSSTPFSINEKDTIELKPVQGDLSLWQAVINVKNYSFSERELGKRSIMLQADIQGGKINTPIITYIPAAFRTRFQ
ncbi:MAG: hypothetical protein IJS08_06735 [Victivallales bacterium]|nr:hypothetical protein [Victivallales bacterium]